MFIDQTMFFNLGILLLGAVLVILLGMVFFQLGSVQKDVPVIEKPAVKVKLAAVLPVAEKKKEIAVETPKKTNTEKQPGFFQRLFAPKSKTARAPAGPSSAPAKRQPESTSDMQIITKQTELPKQTNAKAADNRPSKEEQELAETQLAVAKMEQKEATNGKDIMDALGQMADTSGMNPLAVEIAKPAVELPLKPFPPSSETVQPLSPVVASPPPVQSSVLQVVPATLSTNKEKEKKSGSLMDMFAEHEAEQTESNKVAKDLEQVDVHDLLEESQNIINNMTRRKN